MLPSWLIRKIGGADVTMYRRSRTARFAPFSIVPVLLALTGCSGGAVGPAEAPVELDVRVLHGTATGSGEALGSEGTLTTPFSLATGEDGLVEVRLGDSAVLRVLPGTDATVTARTGGAYEVALDSAAGALWIADAGDAVSTTVTTPDGSVAADDARYTVTCGPDCAVAVLDGTVSAGSDATGVAAGSWSPISSLAPRPITPGSLDAENIRLDLAAGFAAPADDATIRPEDGALAGSYSVVYRAVESDYGASTGAVTRTVEVTLDCAGFDCTLAFSTELKLPDGSIGGSTTTLTFDGTSYHGVLEDSASCLSMATYDYVDGGIAFTGDTTITPTGAMPSELGAVTTAFDAVIVERNVATDAGRDAQCRINAQGPDPYSTTATVEGTGERAE